MASTNKTTNYELSQYVGTDKPTYLGDYNSDMSKIDTAIHGVAENVGTETARINVLEGNIGTLGNLNTTDKSSVVNAVNEVNTKAETNKTNIGTLENLETTNKTTVVNAINEIVEKFNLSTIEDIDLNDITVSSGTKTNCNLKIAKNNDGSIAKIYGSIQVTSNSTNAISVTIPTSLRPTEPITINGCSLYWYNYVESSYYSRISPMSYTINTNGNITFNMWNLHSPGNRPYVAYFIGTIIFVKNFGDTPTPPSE